MLKETELWFKSLRQQDQPISNKKRKCWSLSRSLPELACDPADTARARQHSQESRLRRRTVQMQRRLEALVEQSRRQTALLLRRQQRATVVQRFLRQPVATPPHIHGNEDFEWSRCGRSGCSGSLADRHSCCPVGEQNCAERPAWWHSDPDLRREPCCPAPACRLPCCDPRPPQQTVTQTYCPPQPTEPQNHCPPQQTAPQNQRPPQQTAPQDYCPPQQTAPQNQRPPQQTAPQDYCPPQQRASQNQRPPQQTAPQNYCPPQQRASQNQHPPQQTAPQDYCPPQQTAPQNQRLTQQTAPQDYCPQQTASQNQRPPQPTDPQDYCPQQTAPQDYYPQQTAPQNQRLTQQTAPQNYCSQQTASQNQRPPQQTAPQDYCPQQTAPQDYCPQQTAPQNQRPSQQKAPQDCPKLQTSSQSHCHPQQIPSQNQPQPQPPQPDGVILRRRSRVTFDPAVSLSSSADRAVARCEPPSGTTPHSAARRRSDGDVSVQSPEDRGSSTSAGILKTAASTAEAGPVNGRPSVAENALLRNTDVKPTSGSRRHHDKRGIFSEAYPVPGEAHSHETSCRVRSQSPPARMTTGSGGEEMPGSERQQREGSSSDRSVQSRCPDPSDADQLTVVGRHCQLSPRGSTQNKAAGYSASDKAAVFVEPKLASVATDKGSPTDEQLSSHLAEFGTARSDCQDAGSQSRFEQENRGASSEGAPSQDAVMLHKEQETNKSYQMKDTMPCNDTALDMAPLKDEANAADANAMSPQEHTPGGNPLVMNRNGREQSHQVENSIPKHNVQQPDQELPQMLGKSSNVSEGDQRAFFIDIATDESCTIQSLSEESAGFRGNRTLLLRQLLSQQKIDEAERKRKVSSPRPTRRRVASQGRARNEEMIDVLLHQATSEGKHHLPILPGTGQNTMPFAMQRHEYLDMIGNLRSLRTQSHGDAFHHRDFPQMRLRCGNAATHHHLEHTTDNRSRGNVTPNLASSRAPAGTTLASQSILTRAKPQHASWIENSTHHCSGHHQCVHTEQDNSQHHRFPSDNRKPADHAHAMTHDCDLSLPASQQSDRGQHVSHGNTFHSAPDLYAGSIPASKDTSSAPPTLTSDVASELQQAQATSSELQELSEHKQEKTTSTIPSGVVKEPETSPYNKTDNHPRWQASPMNTNPDIIPSSNPAEPMSSQMMRSLHDEGPHHPTNVSNADSQERRAAELAVKPATDFVSSPGTGPARIAEEWLDDAAGQQRRSARAVTPLTTTSPPSLVGQTDGVSRTATVSGTTLPAATGFTNRSDWREDPVDLRSAADQSRKARVSLGGRAQRAHMTSLAATEAKNWTSVMLVSPQNMEMSFSLSTHLPNIGDQRRQQRRQRTSQEAKGMNSGAVPK